MNTSVKPGSLILIFDHDKLVMQRETNGLMVSEFQQEIRPHLSEKAVVYFTEDPIGRHWYSTDITPILLQDVPNIYRVLVLLLIT